MTAEAIKAAIEQLTESERRELVDWFDELEEQAWDTELEQDFCPGGRRNHLAEKINQEIAQGKCTLLETART